MLEGARTSETLVNVYQTVSYCRSVYTATLYREIITLHHIISLCYTDDMFRTGNVHLQVLHLPIRLLHHCKLQIIHLSTIISGGPEDGHFLSETCRRYNKVK
jgi:hypothetical protein